ncbi:hypothetical protein KJ644_03590 [Candidatus Dependentiae bacterium]|nr:hypothetical protein [Candidatus Dependentiae bacterium]MBU4387530.1 hypothetical protein [Candidatus Dependentiae bacterium]MCG2756530.1 hypothetical protein [Candidatus Dependentiae bacterium]
MKFSKKIFSFIIFITFTQSNYATQGLVLKGTTDHPNLDSEKRFKLANTLRDTKKTKTSDLKKKEKELDKLNKINDIKTEIENRKKEIENNKKNIETLEKGLDEQIKELKTQVGTLSDKKEGIDNKQIKENLLNLQFIYKEEKEKIKDQINIKKQEIQNKETELKNLEENDQIKDTLKQEIDSLKEEITDADKKIAFLDKEKGIGDELAQSISGMKLRDTTIGDNYWEGIKKGTTLRVTGAVGKAIGKNVESYSEQGIDLLIDAISKSITNTYRFIFHRNKAPFTPAEIEAWKKLITSDLEEIKKILSNVNKDSSRGLEEKIRELEEQDENKEEDEFINLWSEFIEDIAITCQSLVMEIENRSAYYSKNNNGFGITTCAQRLKSKLLKIRKWLLSVQSAKDFASIQEVKQIMPAMIKSLGLYFDNLANQTKPLKSSASSSSSYSSSSRKNRHADADDMPYHVV